MTITFDPRTMPTPYLIAFTCAEGLQVGKVVEWINKLWRVRLNTGMSCYVMPDQVQWLS